MVQILPEAPSFGTELARALGKGIGSGVEKGSDFANELMSENLKDLIRKKRLKSGLEGLKGEMSDSSLSPYDLISKLMTTQGVTPELFEKLYPTLLQEQNAQDFIKRKGPPDLLNQPEQMQGEYSPLSGSTEEIERRAADLLRTDRRRFKTPDEAISYEKQRFERQQGLERETEGAFLKDLQTRLQKAAPDTFSDITGDIQRKFLNRAYKDVADGKLSPTKAADKYSEELLDFAKSRQDIKTMGSLLTKIRHPFSGKDNRQRLETARKKYEEIGDQELFYNDLINYQGLSDMGAAHIAYPLAKNKELSHYMAGIKPVFSTTPFREKGSRSFFKGKKEDTIAKEVSKQLKDSDSLLSVAMSLEGKGYNPQKFMAELRNLYDKNELLLNERQRRELTRDVNQRKTLGDYYLYSMTGIK